MNLFEEMQRLNAEHDLRVKELAYKFSVEVTDKLNKKVVAELAKRDFIVLGVVSEITKNGGATWVSCRVKYVTCGKEGLTSQQSTPIHRDSVAVMAKDINAKLREHLKGG
jgi:hypothetical protein